MEAHLIQTVSGLTPKIRNTQRSGTAPMCVEINLTKKKQQPLYNYSYFVNVEEKKKCKGKKVWSIIGKSGVFSDQLRYAAGTEPSSACIRNQTSDDGFELRGVEHKLQRKRQERPRNTL